MIVEAHFASEDAVDEGPIGEHQGDADCHNDQQDFECQLRGSCIEKCEAICIRLNRRTDKVREGPNAKNEKKEGDP